MRNPATIRDRVRELRRVPVSSLIPHPKNWRTHPKAQAEALAGVLAEIGYADALLAREEGGQLHLIDGHLRAETTPDATVPVLVLDVTAEEADKILATLDPLAAMAGADAARLDALLRDVQTGSAAVATMLSDLATASGVIPAQETGAGGDEFDATPEDDGPTRTNVGELWAIGGVHRLLVGDCTDAGNVARLMGGERADCLCWDPPFNVGFEYEGASAGCDNKTPEAYGAWLHSCLSRFAAVAAEKHTCFVWQGMKNVRHFADWFRPYDWRLVSVAKGFVQARPTWLQWATDPVIAWTTDDTARPITQRDFFYNGQSANTKQTEDRKISGRHPCPRSLEVCSYFIGGWTESGQLVLDLSLGSGTTLIAAHRLGRRCYGCEIEPRYADVMLRRAEAEGLEVRRL